MDLKLMFQRAKKQKFRSRSMTTNSDSEEIKRLVRERYGARAKGVIELTVAQPA